MFIGRPKSLPNYYLQLALENNTVKRAFRTAIIVGIILNFINHYQAFITLSFNNINLPMVLLTFMVPYMVSTFSSVAANNSLNKGENQSSLKMDTDKTTRLSSTDGHNSQSLHRSCEHRIKVIQPEEAAGRLKEIYDDIIEKRGKIADVHKIQSLRPESIVKHMDLYLEIMFSKSELSRSEREMMAVVVSVKNGCEYCCLHHSEALNHYWKDRERLNLFISDIKRGGLNEREKLLCDYAEKLTCQPEQFNNDSFIKILKEKNFSDSAILDATLVVSYFNFVNRIVLALGVETNDAERQGYKF
jgi:uncharacterized peroxidase-related enzyme